MIADEITDLVNAIADALDPTTATTATTSPPTVEPTAFAQLSISRETKAHGNEHPSEAHRETKAHDLPSLSLSLSPPPDGMLGTPNHQKPQQAPCAKYNRCKRRDC